MIVASMLTFFAAAVTVLYVFRSYSSGDMTPERAGWAMAIAASLTATSFVLLLAYTLKEFA